MDGAVILVEGESDRVAVETLATRLGHPLDGVDVVAMGGATVIGAALARYGPAGEGRRVLGLYDVAEEAWFARGVARHGLTAARPDRTGLAALGFFVCDADLEDELIRAAGTDGVLGVLAAAGDLDGFRIFQKQPAQRGRPVDAQLRRFLGTRSGRKALYARLLADAVSLERAPAPLVGVLLAV